MGTVSEVAVAGMVKAVTVGGVGSMVVKLAVPGDVGELALLSEPSTDVMR